MELSPFIEPFNNSNYIKSKTYNNNGNISNGINLDNKINNKVFWIDRLLFINSNYIKIKDLSNYCNISNTIDKKILFTENIQLNSSNLNYFRSKCYNNNIINNNRNVKKRFCNNEL